MKKVFFPISIALLSMLILMVSCTTLFSENQSEVIVSNPYDYLFSLYNQYNGSVCLGVSGPYIDKDEAIKKATANCLQMLAFYKGLAVQTDYNKVINTNSDINEFISFSFAGTSDTVYALTANEMEIVNIQNIGGNIGYAVFARIPEMKKIKINGKIGNWKLEIPKIDGYNVTVSTSNSSYYEAQEVIEAATYQAALSFLNTDQRAISVNNTIVTTTSTSYSNNTYSISGNKLYGFVILEYQYDPIERKVYALAVSKK